MNYNNVKILKYKSLLGRRYFISFNYKIYWFYNNIKFFYIMK